MANFNTDKDKKKGLAKGGRKYTFAEQARRDKASKAAAAKKRHDTVMRATGRKRLIKKTKKKG